MPKMKFNTRIKYKGAVHKGLEPFDVDEADVSEMQTRGGVLIVESGKTKAAEADAESAQPEKPGEASKPKGKKKAAGEN